MIPVDRLLYKSEQRINHLSTDQQQYIPVENLLFIINEAQIKLVKKKRDSKSRQDIEFLIEPAEEHEFKLKEVNKVTHRWTAAIKDIQPAFMYYEDAYILADKEQCKNRVIWVNPDLVEQYNVPTLLNNSNYKPSFEYQETFCDNTQDEIGVYTDGSFTPTKLYLSYIRYPEKVDKAGYEDLDGNPSEDRDCEFPEFLENELLDIIEADIKLYTENPSYQTSVQKGLSNE